MRKILEFRSPNRFGTATPTSRYAKVAGVAAVAALVLMATAYWSPRESSYAYATAPRIQPEVQTASFASHYFPVPLHDAAGAATPEEHIEAF
jgi:hypothetical protein